MSRGYKNRKGSFFDCESLPSFSITEKITEMGTNVFTGCRNFTLIIDCGEDFNKDWFKGETGITNLVFTEKVSKISKTEAFQGCSNLKTIDFPKTITS